LAAVFLIASCGREGGEAPTWQQHRFVAHALGVPDGSAHTYCECREGFESSYARGFRVFEADVIMATDGIPFAYHGDMPRRLGLDHDAQVLTMTSSALDALRVDGRFDTLTGHDLLDLLDRHRDAVLMLDTKFGGHTETPLWLLRHAPPDVRRRIVPYVWFDEQISALRREGARSFIVPIHEHRGMDVSSTVRFVRRWRLDTVLGPDAVFTPSAMATLRNAGVRYTYADRGFRRTLDPNEDDVLRKRIARGLGVHSDRWVDP
jgi:hypothetical protein